jgi:hypothetical protein
MTARGRRGATGLQAARGTVQGTHTRRVQGLGRGAWPIRCRPASAFVYGGMAARRRARAWAIRATSCAQRSSCFAVQQALFDHRLLKILKQKWTKRSIAKL